MAIFYSTDPYSYPHQPDQNTIMSSQTEATADSQSGEKADEKKEGTETMTATTTVTVTDNKSMKKVRSKKGRCYFNLCTVKPVLNGHSKIDKTKVLKTNGSLMKVQSIAECSLNETILFEHPKHINNFYWWIRK